MYLTQKIGNLIKRFGNLRISYATNIQMALNNGKTAEIDMILKINEKLIFVETKSGKVNGARNKFKKIIKHFNIKFENAFIISPNGKCNSKRSIDNSIEIKVLNLNDFMEYLENILTNQ